MCYTAVKVTLLCFKKQPVFFNLVELRCATSSQSHIAMCCIAASAPLSWSPILCSPAPLFPQLPSPPNPPQTLQMYNTSKHKKEHAKTYINQIYLYCVLQSPAPLFPQPTHPALPPPVPKHYKCIYKYSQMYNLKDWCKHMFENTNTLWLEFIPPPSTPATNTLKKTKKMRSSKSSCRTLNYSDILNLPVCMAYFCLNFSRFYSMR